MQDRDALNRRELLALLSSGSAAVAGCFGGDGTPTETEATPTETEATPTEPAVVEVTPTRTTTRDPQATPTQAESSTIPEETVTGSTPALLVLSATDGYRHASIEAGNRAIRELADRVTEADGSNVAVDVIDDPDGDAAAFPRSVEALSKYDAVIWNNTTGSVLDDEQQAAFEEYIQSGGGFVGIHAAADTHYDWPWYGNLVGAYFEDHPSVQSANVHVTDRVHPSTDHLPAVWERTDEWYDYRTNPRGDVHVLATLEEDSYENGGMSRADHPIAWCQEYDGGRSWYTGGGHRAENFEDQAFRDHLLGGIAWAAGYVEGDATGTVWDAYEKTPLQLDTTQPMALEVTPDGRVLYIEREGKLGVIHPDGETTTALEMDVYSEQEDGLLGITLDPDFETNGWLYLYYSPPNSEVGDDPLNRLSRFTLEGDSVAPDSEVTILEVGTQRQVCCHAGGDLNFGPDGSLYLTTGDDTNPFESDGYAPLDERDGREHYDSQRTAANTADLRGKVLRIVPEDDGSYSIPEGNLFPESEYAQEIEQGLVREEIYLMGCRNPFRATVDDETGWLYYADYGPDATEWDPARGPPGIVEFNQVREPGNRGWPYCVGPNIPYREYDFATEESGDPFDCEDGPTNDSPNNTGLEDLPSCETATLYYPKDWPEYLDAPDYVDLPSDGRVPFPDLPAGGGPMAGPVFHHRDGFDSAALPRSFEGKHFIAEWTNNWIKYISFDENGRVVEIDPFLPDEQFLQPMDVAIGPGGAMYVVEWGEGWEGTQNPGIYRIEQTV